MANPSPDSSARSRLLVVELWGLGDLALAMPFLRVASQQCRVTLLAKPHAAKLLARFAPGIEHVPFTAPWTAFKKKYLLHRWPWRELRRIGRDIRSRQFEIGVSARHDPRDHLLMKLSGVHSRLGFPRHGSSLLLTEPVATPLRPHRAEHWRSLASALGWHFDALPVAARTGRRIVLHTEAGHPVRMWPRARFEEIAGRLRSAGWDPVVLDHTVTDLDTLLDTLASADRFVGNDSGPGHLAALSAVPTFTIFGPQLPEVFAPQHPGAEWIEGAPCPYKPCFDACRFPEPFCIRDVSVDAVWTRLQAWLAR